MIANRYLASTFLAIAAIAAIAAPTARARTVNHLYDRFQIAAAGADVLLGTTIQVDNSDGTRGTELDQGVLGMPQHSGAPLFAGAWRPGRRHGLALSYIGIGRSGERTLSDTISFADTTFSAGLKVETEMSAPTIALGYRFAVLAKENTLAGVQVRLGAAFFSLDINAVAGTSISGGDSAIVPYAASEDVLGPTASLGLFGQFRASDRWYFAANGGAIGVNVDNITARTWVIGGGAEYFLSNRVGFSAGYHYSGIKVSVATEGSGGIFDPDLVGSFQYSYQSFSLGVIVAFQ